MRLLDREREGGAHLITVERAMASRIHPARAMAGPVARRRRAQRAQFARAVVAIAGAAGAEILTAAAAKETPEAEAAVELDRLVRIAFAGGDGIAKAGDEHVAHRDLGGDALRRAVAERNIDGGDRRLPGTRTDPDFLIARHRVLPDRPVAVIEAP